MRILIAGFAVFVLWSLFSVWLYVEKIRPGISGPETVQLAPESQSILADTTLKAVVLMPEDLTLLFEFDDVSFISDPQLEESMSGFKSWLDNNPLSNLTVTGYTDIIGTEEYNLALGMKRALSVKSYLEKIGIESDRMVVSSKGKSEPDGSQATEAGRARNRRAVIKVIK